MKYLLFLIFPFIVNAQTACPDTIYTLDNKVYPCLVTSISESDVKFNYPGYGESMLVTNAISRLFISGKGKVFEQDKKYLYAVEELEMLVAERQEVKQYFEEQRWKKEEEKGRLLKKQTEKENLIRSEDSIVMDSSINQITVSPADVSYISKQRPFQIDVNRWSFGILFIPYSSGKLYAYVKNSNYDQGYITTTINNEINMEGQFALRINNRLSLTLDVGYTSGSVDYNYESHNRQTAGSGYDEGHKDSDDLKILDFHIGLKYYFTNYFDEKVNAYILGGVGKKLAFATSKYEQLYVAPSAYINEDNQDEFTEEMNSPFSAYFGFGAEYMFNQSLSVYSVIRFYYSRIHAEYNSRTVSQGTSNEYRRILTQSDFITRIGLGLNFYF